MFYVAYIVPEVHLEGFGWIRKSELPDYPEAVVTAERAEVLFPTVVEAETEEAACQVAANALATSGEIPPGTSQWIAIKVASVTIDAVG